MQTPHMLKIPSCIVHLPVYQTQHFIKNTLKGIQLYS